LPYTHKGGGVARNPYHSCPFYTITLPTLLYLYKRVYKKREGIQQEGVHAWGGLCRPR
jgi:hypothetical protein